MADSTGISTNLLDGAIIVLTAAKAGVTGLGVPGVEPAINGVLQIATMISTMKANKEDLLKLGKRLEELTACVNAPSAHGDLQNRLIKLSSWVSFDIDLYNLTVGQKIRCSRQ
ncbi:hypothetical protein B0H13DRAFT_1857426 [Mycena leptocephala]|nr:hypothetical protein B0H13DRAFT_1857426 [Mycena leptocephala]